MLLASDRRLGQEGAGLERDGAMDVSELAAGVIAGDRRALARGITLVESNRADHRKSALDLTERLRATGREALRIGLSGTPGVGKSTFIESFGLMLAEGGLALPLDELLATAGAAFAAVAGFKPAEAAIADFIYERLSGNLREQGYSAQEVEAVLCQKPQLLADIRKRLAAVRAFAALPEAAALAELEAMAGRQFDPELVQLFVRQLKRTEV